MTTTRRVVLLACSLVALTLGLCSSVQAKPPSVPRPLRHSEGNWKPPRPSWPSKPHRPSDSAQPPDSPTPFVRHSRTSWPTPLHEENRESKGIWLEEKKLILYDEVAINLATDVMALPGNIHAVNVAFEYEEYHFLGMSVWARKGRYFLFVNRIRRLHPTDEQWRALIGGLPTSKFRKPFWYQVSMWPVILGSFIVYNVVRRFVRQTAQKKLNMLKRDRHYQLARETYFRNEEGDETLVTKPDERRFTSAKSVLVGQGVQPNKVDANLQLLIGSELKENNHRITQEFQSGEALEAKEKWEDCVELYSKLAKLIPLDDARHPRAAGLLEVARRKLAERQSASPINAANATNKDDEAVGT